MTITQHEPVLLKEVIDSLHINKLGKFIDATLGAGGYTKAILEAGGEVLGIDTDESMLRIARENLKAISRQARNDTTRHSDILVNGNFRDIKKIAEENGFEKVEGIVFDLGVSNVHFMDDERGFSFR